MRLPAVRLRRHLPAPEPAEGETLRPRLWRSAWRRLPPRRRLRELVTSIFLPDSPIHDGALIVQNGRITAAGCFLPLTANPNVSKTLGTRHRAAIGLTEETDAVVIVVSEEDGTISLAREGKITRDVDGATLRTTLQRLLAE